MERSASHLRHMFIKRKERLRTLTVAVLLVASWTGLLRVHCVISIFRGQFPGPTEDILARF